MGMSKKLLTPLLILVFLSVFFTALPITPASASPAIKYVATTGSDNTGDGSQGTPWATIQHAIDNVVSGDTIIVNDGKYSEDLDINGITGLTLKSVNGAGSTIISGISGVVITIRGSSNDFTLGGVGTGFSINGSASSTFLLQITNGESGVTIEGNVFNTTGNPSMGISIGAAGAVGLTINNNTFSIKKFVVEGDGYIWGPRISGGVTVTNNTFIGPGDEPASGYAIQFAGVTGTSIIARNTIINITQVL